MRSIQNILGLDIFGVETTAGKSELHCIAIVYNLWKALENSGNIAQSPLL